jgi:hypothetical protein
MFLSRASRFARGFLIGTASDGSRPLPVTCDGSQPPPVTRDGSQPLPVTRSLLLRVTRDYLTDGYISYTFTPQIAEFLLAQLLFKVDNSRSIEAFLDPNRSGAYFVFNHPSHFSPPPLTMYGRGAWVLDYCVRTGGSVVPQKLCFPQGEGNRRRYVDQAPFRIPVFFVGRDEGLGVPVLNAAAGRMQLCDARLPPPLQDRTMMAKIRIAVRAFFFCAVRSPITYQVCHSGRAMILPNNKFNLGIKLLE